jgi:hypothetical protein
MDRKQELEQQYAQAKEVLASLKKQIKDEGYILKSNGKLEKDEKVWVISWGFSQYDHKVDAYCYYDEEESYEVLGKPDDLRFDHLMVILEPWYDLISQFKLESNLTKEKIGEEDEFFDLDFWLDRLDGEPELLNRFKALVSETPLDELVVQGYTDLTYYLEEYVSGYFNPFDSDCREGWFHISEEYKSKIKSWKKRTEIVKE